MPIMKTKRYGYKLFMAAVVFVCMIIGIMFAAYTAQIGSEMNAEAALPDIYSSLLTNRGLNIYDTTDFRGTHTYDNLITSNTHSNAVDTTYGDYHFANMGGTVSTNISDDGVQVWKNARVPKGQNRSYDETDSSTFDDYRYMGFIYQNTGSVPSNAAITVTVPIFSDSNLYKAINDKMLDVKIMVYAQMLNFSLGSGTDYATGTIVYNNGEMSTQATRQVTFPENPYPDREYEYIMSNTLTLSSCGEGAYVQYKLSDFIKNGDNFCMVISKLAIRVTVTVKNFRFIEPEEEDVMIVDAQGTRDADARTDMVKKGDIIYINTGLIINETYLTVNNGTAGDTNPVGKFYRNLYLRAETGSARTSTAVLPGTNYLVEGSGSYTYHDMVSWQYDKTALTRIYRFTDAEGNIIDLTNGYSAMSAAFLVNDSTKDSVNIKCSMKDANGNIILGENDLYGDDSGLVFTYLIDSQLPNAPALSASSTFYQKYITGKSYYTKAAGYNYENDGLGVRQVKSVLIGSQSEGSDAVMSAQALTIQGLSEEIVYYRVTKLDREPNNYTAELFTREQATGIYCFTRPTLSLVNGRYTVTGKTTVYQGMELMLREGTPEQYTYPKQGIFKVEFISYDSVGNISATSTAVIIRVDVADYTFDVVTKIGTTEVTTLTNDTFSLVYYALNDNNQLETRNNATFKRGDRIVLKLDFTATGYSNYILTYFQTPAGMSLNTSDFPYDNYDAVYLTNKAQSTAIPTFTLDSNYSGDDKAANRRLILTFKIRAMISVSNTTQVYEPNTPRNVTAIATVNGKKVSNVTIQTTYSESPDGSFRSVSPDFPMNAGTYYYRCELNSSTYYGIVSNRMTIVPATPVISELRVTAIDYGDSLAKRDTVFNEALGRYVMSDSIFCSYTYFDEAAGVNRKISVNNRSSDGVYGYFSIIDPSKTSANYTKPSAGTIRVKVLFTPIVMLDPDTPKYENGNFVVNTNYFTVTISDVTLVVNHSPDVTMSVENVNVEGKVVTDYTGLGQNITVNISAVDDGRTILLSNYLVYTFTNTATGTTSAALPVEAGTYTVNFSLNKNLCNYTGTWTQEFVIRKRKLIVFADNVTVDFQREVKPNPIARYYYAGGSIDYAGLNYDFAYFRYTAGLTNSEMAVEENRVPGEEMFNGMPQTAGKYLVRIRINDVNLENESDVFIVYTINKVSSLGSQYITAEFPNLSWTSATSGYHLNYLQPLKAINISTNQDTIVRYSYHYMDLGKVKYRYERVDGRFIVAYRRYEGDHSPEDVAAFVEEMGQYSSLTVGQHQLYLYFVPSEENLVNFNLIYIASLVNVGKAQPVFYDVTVEAITYGKTINSIDDLAISKDSAGGHAVKFKLYTDPVLGTQYYYMPADQYTYSLYSVSNPLLPAGTHNVIITFRPNDTANFEQANGTVSVTVNKRPIGVTFEQNANYDDDTDTYIYPYRAYANAKAVLSTASLVKPADNPPGSYTFYRYDPDNAANFYKGAVYANATLVVGKYVVEYNLNDTNYSGGNRYVVEIIKDDLRRAADPIINFAATAVSYGKLMSAVTFSGGSMLSAATGQRVEGTYYFNYPAGTVFTDMGRQNLMLRFVPNDTDNYNIYEGDGSTPYTIQVTVTRADISSQLTLSVRSDYVYGDLRYDWNYTDVSYTAPIYTNGVDFATNKLDETYHFIPGTYSITNRPMTGYFNAGTYYVTFTVSEDGVFQKYYTGSITVPLTIAKKKAVMVVENNVKYFDNKAKNADVGVYLAVIDGGEVTLGEKLDETVSQTFFKDGVRMTARPSAIGLYTVELVLQSVNYEYYYGEKLVDDFTIAVDSSQIIISNLNQVYSVPRPLGISLGINSAVYTVRYYDIISGTEYATLPVNAGTYEVKLFFDPAANNGYEGVVTYRDRLVIDKYTAAIITSEVVSVVYTGKPNTISARTEPYNLPFTVTYRRQGATEFTAEEVLEANTGDGYHEVKFTIVSGNYKGEKVIRYYILPADLTVESHPTFGTYVYNTATPPAVITQGLVRFGYERIIENGIYEIPLESIRYLDTGTYNVTYHFTALNGEGEADTNFRTATGICQLVIVKQTIDAGKIIIPDDIKLTVNYNTGYHYVYAVLCSGEGGCDCALHYDASDIDKDGLIYNIGSNNRDFTIRIKYNGSSTPARSVAEYILSAEIVSKNYQGSKTFASKMIVNKGVPEIRVNPTVKESVSLNIIYDGSTYIYPTVGTGDIVGGEAYIAGTSTRIGGTFTIDGVQELKRANVNRLSGIFTPSDGSFAEAEFTIDVKVNGVNPLSGVANNTDWTNAAISSNVAGLSLPEVRIEMRPVAGGTYARYGANLSRFELFFINVSDGSINTDYTLFGYLGFVNPAHVPDVGEKVAVNFTPYESQNALYGYVYNEMYGEILAPVTKIDAPALTFRLKAFEGKTLNDEMVFELYNGPAKTTLKGGSLTIYTDSTKTTLFDLGLPVYYEEANGENVYIVYSSLNYDDIEGYVAIEVLNRIAPSDINIGNMSKEYSEDVGITVNDIRPLINAAVGIGYEHITLEIRDGSGNITDGREIGTYTITVIVDNGEYYGTKVVSGFTVTKRDISGEISLSESSSTYGESEVPRVIYKGQQLDKNYYTIMYKRATAPDTSYSTNMGDDSATYSVRVTISSENYTGSAVFTYVIEPVRVRVIAYNREVLYASLDASRAPEVTFKALLGEDEIILPYTLYYYNDNYTITTNKPSDVGVYTVRCVIDDTNYAPYEGAYVEFLYTINRASVQITTLPIVLATAAGGQTYHLKYGQTLGDIRMTGGEARRNNEPVPGTFSISNTAVKPNAGTYRITIVFTPFNANLSSAQANLDITVARGDAQVIVDNLYAKYDGTSKRSHISVTVQPTGVQVAIVFTNSKNETIAEPTNAGNYYINAVSLNNNYNVTISKSADGSLSPRLVISKAKVQMINGVYRINDPVALPITAGDSLAKSSLSKGAGYGEVYYEGFNMPIDGSFTYVQSALIFNTAGTYTTGYIFTPDDINNFDTYTGTVAITVNKAFATISVANTEFVYGEGFRLPTFTTNPAGLTYAHNITFNEYDPTSGSYNPNDVIAAGTYYFRVWITSPNYAREENTFEFAITIRKKAIDLSFVNASGEVVTQYVTTYGVPLNADIRLYPANNTQGKRGYLLKDEFENGIRLGERRETRYRSTDKDANYDAHVAPRDRGSYEVTVSIISDNYTATGTIMYVINRGIIEEIIFDTSSLENQIYGMVTAPIIYTRPSNISYYIVYQGYGTKMPTDAGTYNIMVYFDDNNYEKKQIFAMFRINPMPINIGQITVRDKVYDGVSSIEIEGKLQGVRPDDEVELVMKATTANNDPSVGAHYVTITEYRITGLAASNYVVAKPVYDGQVNIYTKVVTASNGGSYITSPTGFKAGTTVEVKELDIKENKTNIFTKAMGIESKVIGFSLKENGEETILSDLVKVYIAIPDEFLDADFEVKPYGNMKGQTILFDREGNYITFYTNSTGSVVFEKTQFKYGFAVTVISIGIIIIGVVVMFILNPFHSRSKTTDRSREKAIIKRLRSGF
ncbi:MAG TPA: MBG domain-containing protein [Clostridia bacterium]|nr:MBG domain-containing protein [Clostridia bacterium]